MVVKRKSYIDSDENDYSGRGYTADYNGVATDDAYSDFDEDDYDISSDVYDIDNDMENDVAAEFIKTMEANSKKKPKKDDEDDEDDDDSTENEDNKELSEHVEDDVTTLSIVTFIPQILGAKTEEFYTMFMSRINKKISENPRINTLDFTGVEIDDYKELKEKIESNTGLTCVRSVLVEAVTADNRPIIYIQDLIDLSNNSPLDNIDEICLHIREIVKDGDFVLKYNLNQELTKASYITLAACIALTFKGRVTLDTTNISVGIAYNKAISSLMLPFNDDPLKSIDVIKNYYLDNYRKGQLVIICDDISIYSMMSTGYAAIIENIGSELITLKKIPTCEILNRKHKRNARFLRTSIRYSDINILKSLVLPIELTEEYPIVKAALKDPSFSSEIDLSKISPVNEIVPNITPLNIEKTYYALSNGISHVERAFLNKLKSEALLKSKN